MKKNPWKSLVESRKFWLMILDLVVSSVLYFSAKYVGEGIFADIKFLIAAFQPAFIIVIYAIAKEDAALKSNGNYLRIIGDMNAEECCEEAE